MSLCRDTKYNALAKNRALRLGTPAHAYRVACAVDSCDVDMCARSYHRDARASRRMHTIAFRKCIRLCVCGAEVPNGLASIEVGCDPRQTHQVIKGGVYSVQRIENDRAEYILSSFRGYRVPRSPFFQVSLGGGCDSDLTESANLTLGRLRHSSTGQSTKRTGASH
eukprot:3833213-Pyramimonas_sp.AAC.2